MNHRPPVLKNGDLIGGCSIQQFLGQGGMGQVYLAEHLRLVRPVAVKILPPDVAYQDYIERFYREARVASRIDHPNVVTIHDVGEQDGLYFIVMQYIRGKNLAELLESQGGVLPWRSALRMIQLACHGLHAVHLQGLVHRDIKPSNIMFSTDARVFLMDFGLVREELDLSRGQPGSIAGTPPFMSPEQCTGQPLDRRSDIFSMGSSLYYLLAGRPPFSGSSGRDVAQQIASKKRAPPIHDVNPQVPLEVSWLLEKAMSPEPNGRFFSAAVMAGELKKLLRGGQLKSTSTWAPAVGSPPCPSPAPAPPMAQSIELLPLDTREERWRRVWPWIATAAVVVLMIVVMALLSRPHAGDTPVPETAKTANMARIEAGYARIGDAPEKLRQFYSNPAVGVNEKSLDSCLAAMAEETRQRVFVPAFRIDKYEVTNAEYARFLAATGRPAPKLWKHGRPQGAKEDCPVTGVSYEDAEAYATWKGKRLPTREQWMRAYRGDEDRLFPWGDHYDSTLANVGENPTFRYTSPIAATPGDVSPFGVYNLVGNASEFIRGTAQHKGKSWRLVKGSEYKMKGSVWGSASGHMFYGLEFVDEGTGFRCVIEEGTPPD